MKHIKLSLSILFLSVMVFSGITTAQNPYAIFGYEGVVYDVKKPEPIDVSVLTIVNADSNGSVLSLVLDFQNRIAYTYSKEGLLLNEASIPVGVFARWMATDVYRQFHSPYMGMGNNPIRGVDPDGGYVFFKGKAVGTFLGSLDLLKDLLGFDYDLFREFSLSADKHITIKFGNCFNCTAKTLVKETDINGNATKMSILINKKVLKNQPNELERQGITAANFQHEFGYHIAPGFKSGAVHYPLKNAAAHSSSGHYGMKFNKAQKRYVFDQRASRINRSGVTVHNITKGSIAAVDLSDIRAAVAAAGVARNVAVASFLALSIGTNLFRILPVFVPIF